MDEGIYYDEGFEAFWDGKDISECPHDDSEFNDIAHQWKAGWFDAYVETK